MQKPKDNLKGASVSVYTWGTEENAGRLSKFIEAHTRGINVGHAAVAVSFPATAEGMKLVEQYCLKDGNVVLPFVREKQNIQLGISNDGKPQFGQQDIYTVYFSWWPPNAQNLNGALVDNINADGKSERPGAGWIEGKSNPNVYLEQRTYRGLLGKKNLTLAPNQIFHDIGLQGKEKEFIQLEHHLSCLERDLNNIIYLDKKLKTAAKSPLAVTSTLKNALNIYLPNWSESVTDISIIDVDMANTLLNNLQKMKTELTEKKRNIGTRKKSLQREIRAEADAAIRNEVNILKEILSMLPAGEQNALLAQYEHQYPVVHQKYKLDEINDQIELTNGVSCLTMGFKLNDEDNNKAENEKALLIGALFDGIDPKANDGTSRLGSNADQIMKNWRFFLPDQYRNITKAEISLDIITQVCKIAKASKVDVQKKQMDARARYATLYLNEHPVLANGSAKFLTTGHAPDHTISLPVSGISRGNSRNPGLNIEDMLSRMRYLKDSDKKFNLSARNCSYTVGSILEAGADKEHKRIINPKVMGGGLGTPQAVYEGAKQYALLIYEQNGKLNKAQIASQYNPLNLITNSSGKLLRNTANDNNSMGVRILSGIGLAGMAIPTGIAASINKLGSKAIELDTVTQSPPKQGHYDPSAANIGQINHEIEIGKDDIKSPREAIQTYIESSKIEGSIPSFHDNTMSVVFKYLAQHHVNNDKALSDEYMKATQVVIKRQAEMIKENKVASPQRPEALLNLHRRGSTTVIKKSEPESKPKQSGPITTPTQKKP